MSEHDYTLVLVLLWASVIAGAFISRQKQAQGILDYVWFLGPAVVVLVLNLSGLLSFWPLTTQLPDLESTWNTIIYSGMMTGISLFLAFRIRDNDKTMEDTSDPR